MSVCAHRPEAAGIFTPCDQACGTCLCATDLHTDHELANGATA